MNDIHPRMQCDDSVPGRLWGNLDKVVCSLNLDNRPPLQTESSLVKWKSGLSHLMTCLHLDYHSHTTPYHKIQSTSSKERSIFIEKPGLEQSD